MIRVIGHCLWVLVLYLISVVVIKNILQDLKYKNPNVAYIPVFNAFALADAIPEVDGKVYITKGFAVDKSVFTVFFMLSQLLGYVPYVAIIGYILQIIGFYKISCFVYSFYEKRTEQDMSLLAGLTAVFPIIFWVKNLIYVAKKGSV